VNATWTVRVERLEIRLPVGIHADELEPQPLWVSLTATGRTPATPDSIEQCFDYEPLCRWMSQAWPQTPHTPLLETRVNQLLAFAFGLDRRVQKIWVGLYKQRMSSDAVSVGIERQATRGEFEAQQRSVAMRDFSRPNKPAGHGKESHAADPC
jgi:dihydroneopterin aldolase